MKFSRYLPASEPGSLIKIERYLRRRDVPVSRNDDRVHGELFRWSEVLTAKDADRMSWRAVRAENRDASSVALSFAYNWSFQAIAQVLLSGFVFALVARFGDPSMLSPMLVSANILFLAASVTFAVFYANRMAKELAEAVADDVSAEPLAILSR